MQRPITLSQFEDVRLEYNLTTGKYFTKHIIRFYHWKIGIGLGVSCVHPDNQEYNPKHRKEGEDKNYWNSTTQVSRIPMGCELRKERD